MLKPEHVVEIRKWDEWSELGAADVIRDLLADRAEIRQELERIRDTMIDYNETQTALTALIERLK